MLPRLSADTDLIRAYGSASSDQAEELQAVVARLTALGTRPASMPASVPVSMPTSMFGPVGARFQAALTQAAEREAHRFAELSVSLAAARSAGWRAAQAYSETDAGAGNEIAGNW